MMKQSEAESLEKFEVYLNQGKQYLEKRQLDKAAGQFSMALRLKPDSIAALKQMAETYILEEKIEKAILLWTRLIELKPNAGNLYFRLAKLYLQVDNIDLAFAALQKVIDCQHEIPPQFRKRMKDLARQEADRLMKQNRYPEAESYYRLALEMKPENYEAHLGLGDALRHMNRIEEAMEYYLASVRIKPKFVGAFTRFAVLIRQGQLSSANLRRITELRLNEVYESQNPEKIYSVFSQALAQHGNVSESIAYNKKATYQLNLSSKPEFVKNYWDESAPRKPNFIVIGFMKCGTTSLFDYISQHPRVLRAFEKEIEFFNRDDLYKLGVEWYRSNFPPIPSQSGYLSGEATPNYITCGAKAAQKVQSLFPDLKFIVALRNPVQRAISHYYFSLKRGAKHQSFEKKIDEDINKLNEKLQQVNGFNNINRLWGIVLSGLYVYFLEQWMNIFPKEQFLILKTEDLAENTSDTMSRVFNFLGLPAYEQIQYPQKNKGSYSSNINEEILMRLQEFYRPHNQRLEELMGCKFDWE